MADLRVNFCGVELKNPITTASGTSGFGHEYGEFFDLSQLGGIGVKGLIHRRAARQSGAAHRGNAAGHSELCRPAEPGH